MAIYTDKNGNVTFDAETVARLTKLADDIESGKEKLIELPRMSDDEFMDYLMGEMSPDLQRRFDELNKD